MVFDDKCGAKPLRVIFGVLPHPLARTLGERPNERKRALWQNPDIRFASGAVHCLSFFFANRGIRFNRK
jgi:hypothetical protein